MTKLKLGPLADDKPVKITIELPAAVHRDLVAYAQVLGRTSWPNSSRSFEAHRADGRAIHGDRPRLREGAPRSERSGRWRFGREIGIVFA